MAKPETPDQRHHRSAGEQQPSQLPRLQLLGGLFLIVVAICVAYVPVMSAGFVWDDDAHVTKPELQSGDGLQQIWFQIGATQQYYPLLHTAFWVEYQLWGDHPLGYHLMNLLLHATAACLVCLILRKLEIPGALLAAAIFALHPVHVESVAWITEQKNTLSAVFYLSAMLAYLHFEQTRHRGSYTIALGLFVLALLSKTTAVTLPAALLVIFWWKRGSLSWQRDVKPLVPFFLLAVMAGLFAAWMEIYVLRAQGAPFQLSLTQRTLLASRAVWFYLGKLVWPNELIFMYPRWKVSAAIWWQWLFLPATVAVFVALWLLRRRWRGPLAAWLFFVGTMFPMLGYFNQFLFLYTFVSDHFQYLPSLGIFVLAAACVALVLARLAPMARRIGQALCVGVLAMLAVLTWQQSNIYADNVTLFQAMISKNPECWMAYNNLGLLLAHDHRQQDAMAHYEKAISLNPDYADAHNNLGMELFNLGRPEEAIPHYRQALKARSEFPAALTNLGNALVATGHPDEAMQEYFQALAIHPNMPMAHFNLGNSLVNAGRLDEALEHYRQALRVQPRFAAAHYNLGTLLARMGKPQEAIPHFEETLRLKPNSAEAHNNLGNVLQDAGRTEEALEHYREALQLNPTESATYVNLRKIYVAMNRSAEAIATARQALELARSQGDQALANQIEDWISKYRAQLGNPPDAAPSSAVGSPR